MVYISFAPSRHSHAHSHMEWVGLQARKIERCINKTRIQPEHEQKPELSFCKFEKKNEKRAHTHDNKTNFKTECLNAVWFFLVFIYFFFFFRRGSIR